jgi:transketolase
MEAAAKLGPEVRVVSMPCLERFERQPASYREDVLPSSCDNRISIEAGVTQPWYRYVGLHGRAIGIDRFGLSAPGGTVMKELGISTDALVTAGREMLARG